jgi:hypothetical protein
MKPAAKFLCQFRTSLHVYVLQWDKGNHIDGPYARVTSLDKQRMYHPSFFENKHIFL